MAFPLPDPRLYEGVFVTLSAAKGLNLMIATLLLNDRHSIILLRMTITYTSTIKEFKQEAAK